VNTSLYGGVIELAPDGQPITPELVLAFRSGTKQGTIRNISNFTITKYLAEADEITFDVHKSVNGTECKLWDDLTDFKLVYIPHFDSNSNNPWYELEVTVDEDDETVKHCEGVHIQEAELSQLSLNGVEINTEDDIARDDYVVTIVYNKDNPDGSLLNRILKDKAPHYEIWHVDPSIAKLQRTFSWNNSTIKDALDDIATEVDGLFRYGEYNDSDGKIHRTISLYDLEDVCVDCGERGSFIDGKCTNCGSSNIRRGYGQDSGIFINSENFAKSITYSSNKDKVKNCFRLVAGDDLMTATIRNINPNGGQYIWYIGDDVRSMMSPALREKLKSYDAEYAEYNTSKIIDIPESTINDYNALIDKYKPYDKTLTEVSYPIKGYSTLTDFYYQALNLYSLLKTSLIPASEHGSPTTASEEIKKLTQSTLSPLGLRNADIASSTTVNLAVANYAKVYVDTSLYKVSAQTKSYTNNVWIGTLTLERYSDKEDTATTSELTINVTSATADFLKCQIEKTMKKKETDASGIVALFKMSDSEFKERLGYYSADNLELLANICRGCLDVMIEQGVADKSVSAYADLYNTLYLPYYNKSRFIEDELRERESELLKLRGTIDSPEGVLDKIEEQRSAIAGSLDLKEYLGDTLWAEFCSFRRDDEYKNNNFISDGLSDSELIKQAKEFLKSAQKEIIKSATLQHTISCNLNDILLVSENDIKQSLVPIVTANGKYVVTHDGSKLVARLIREDTIMSPLLDKFDIGNWLHIEVDDKVYKLRMISYQIDYDDLSKLDVKFSDVTYAIGYMSDTKSILSKMSSMATSYSTTMRQANKGEKANQQLVDMVQNGLALTDKKIVSSARNQNMVVDETGLLMREKNEYGDDYNDEQTKIINYGLYYTKDNWKTVETGLGKFIYYDPEDGNYKQDYGLIANKIVGNIILGNEVGIYNRSGSIKMNDSGLTVTSDSSDENKDLFTVRKKNNDGSYTNYIYVDENGDVKINGSHIEMAVGDSLSSYIDRTAKDVSSENLLVNSDSATGCHTEVQDDTLRLSTDSADDYEIYTYPVAWIVDSATDEARLAEGYIINDSVRVDGEKVTTEISPNPEYTNSKGSKYIFCNLSKDAIATLKDGQKILLQVRACSDYPVTLNLSIETVSGSKTEGVKCTDTQSITLSSGWVSSKIVFTVTNIENVVSSPNGVALIIRDNMGTGQSYRIDYIKTLSTISHTIIDNIRTSGEELTTEITSSIDGSKFVYYNLREHNLPTFETGGKLTASIRAYSDDPISLSISLTDNLGTTQLSDEKQISLPAGWSNMHTVLTLSDANVANGILKIADNLASGKSYRIDYIQLNTGSRATSYRYTPESEYFSMENDGLRITRKIPGQSASDVLSMLLNEKRLSFFQGTDEVAYFSNNKLYVNSADINGRITSDRGQIGGWDIQGDAITHRYDDGTYYWDRLMYSGAGIDYLLVRKTKKSDNSVSYPFYVHRDGYLYAENANIKGRVSADYITVQNSIDMYRSTYGEVDQPVTMFKYVNTSMTQSGALGNKDLYIGDGQLENLIFGKFTYGATATQSTVSVGSTNLVGVHDIDGTGMFSCYSLSADHLYVNPGGVTKFKVNGADGVVETCSIIDMHDYSSSVDKEDFQIRLFYNAYSGGAGKGLNVQGGNGATETNLSCISPNGSRSIYLYANGSTKGIYAGGGSVSGSVMNVSGSGPQWYGTMHNWSDIRLKKNVADTEIKSALDTINKIKVRSFDWKATNKHQKVGFIADEIEQVDDAFTTGGGYDEKGNMSPKSIDGFYLQAYEVKAIQELSKLVDDLKKENAELKKIVNNIAVGDSI
jgi:hypothetical protein